MKPLILIVENDAATQRLMRVLLHRQGWDVDAVARGDDAQTLLERVDYSAVLLDLMLPGKSGFDVLESIAAGDRSRLRRVVVTTSAPDVQLSKIRTRWPETKAVRKPFDLAELEDSVRLIVETVGEPRLERRAEFCRSSVMSGARAGLAARAAGEMLSVVTYFGYSSSVTEPHFPMPRAAALPICQAAQGKPLFFSDMKSAIEQFPQLLPFWRQDETRSIAALPVMSGEQVVGAAGWSFREQRTFDETERAVLARIAAESAPLVAVETEP